MHKAEQRGLSLISLLKVGIKRTPDLLPAVPRRRLASTVGAGPRGPKLSLAQNWLNTSYFSDTALFVD